MCSACYGAGAELLGVADAHQAKPRGCCSCIIRVFPAQSKHSSVSTPSTRQCFTGLGSPAANNMASMALLILVCP
jgi:hypothetical protein